MKRMSRRYRLFAASNERGCGTYIACTSQRRFYDLQTVKSGVVKMHPSQVVMNATLSEEEYQSNHSACCNVECTKYDPRDIIP